MDFVIDLIPRQEDADEGIQSFLSLLRLLEKQPLFAPFWAGLDTRLWEETETFQERFREREAEFGDGSGFHIVEVLNNPDGTDGAAVRYSWNTRPGKNDVVTISIRGPHPTLTYDASLFARVCEVILEWRSVQHMSLAWPGYRRDLQPLDQARRGIGWLGWLPFLIQPDQVPEAEICRPMGRGTFLATRNALWFSHGPNADQQAVQQAQALEHRLNRLGLLPTFEELRQGRWGQ